jgi:hypothetical protein
MMTITHKFVDVIPDQIENGIIYISIKYCTAIHKCCCGCQEEVVTPLSPVDWALTFNGRTISLYPSIGNWNYKCQSHYWITNNKIKWAEKWSLQKIKKKAHSDQREKIEFFKKKNDS